MSPTFVPLTSYSLHQTLWQLSVFKHIHKKKFLLCTVVLYRVAPILFCSGPCQCSSSWCATIGRSFLAWHTCRLNLELHCLCLWTQTVHCALLPCHWFNKQQGEPMALAASVNCLASAASLNFTVDSVVFSQFVSLDER